MSEMTQVLGTVAMEPKGEWSSETYYEKLNTVLYNDSTYMAKEGVVGENPSTSSKWQLIGGGVTKEYVASKIVDNLDSSDATKMLSAKQGKVLDGKKPTIYENVASMKIDTNLKEGMTVHTLGYYSVNDGGHGEYVIVDDETLVDDGGSIHVLNNGLRAKLLISGVINVKQFGAYGDNTHDDTSYLLNALTFMETNKYTLFIPNGYYLINDNINLPSGEYVGETDSVIVANSFTEEAFIRNKNYASETLFDTLIIKNIKVYKKYVSDFARQCFQFRRTRNMVLENIICYSDIDTNMGGIDLYSNNKDAILKNCRVYKTNSSATKNISGFRVREYLSETTENITIKDCIVEKDGIDESLWINGWRGHINNVTIDNISIIDHGTQSASTLFVGANDNNTSVENVKIINSYIHKDYLYSSIVKLGSNEYSATGTTIKDILMDNCIIEVDTNSRNVAQMILFGNYMTDNSLVVSNCILRNNDSTNMHFAFISSDSDIGKSQNNKFYGGYASICVNGIHESINDYFDVKADAGIFRNVPIIKNVKSISNYILLNNYNSTKSSYIIKDCDVICTRLVNDNSSDVDTTYTIDGCKLYNAQQVFQVSSLENDRQITFNFSNSDFHSYPISGTNNFTLNMNNITKDGVLLKGIPSWDSDRNNCPIGTVLFSETATKSIVRKISAGNQTSNWEEI